MRLLIFLFTIAIGLAVWGDAYGGVVRSYKVRSDFVKVNACPANATHKLPCPGFIMDHKQPLDCHGPDDISNIQWLTVEAWKAKSKWERASTNCDHPYFGATPPYPLPY